MARRRREPWGSGIAAILAIAVVIGLIRGSPLGFMSNPMEYLVICGVAGGCVGYFEARPERAKRIKDAIRARFSIPGALICAVIALILSLPPVLGITLTLAGGYFQGRPDRRQRIARTVGIRIRSSARWLTNRATRRKRR